MNEIKSEFETTLIRLLDFHVKNSNDAILASNYWEMKLAENENPINSNQRKIPNSNIGFRKAVEFNGKLFHITVDLSVSDEK